MEKNAFSSANTKEQLEELLKNTFVEHLGITLIHIDDDTCVVGMKIVPENMMAPNGFVHGGVISSLADTACGMGSIYHLEKNQSFTTIEFKINFIATPTKARISCKADLIHKGRTTQVWDAKVTEDETSRTIAHFRCTQMIIQIK
tara:strand:+ start:2165 stop:2599 length:435 start_codon:yes stop_codon:yes gene_type:complete